MSTEHIQPKSETSDLDAAGEARLELPSPDVALPPLRIEERQLFGESRWRVTGEIDDLHLERWFPTKKAARDFANRIASEEHKKAVAGAIRTLLSGASWTQLAAARSERELRLVTLQHAPAAIGSMRATATVTVTDFTKKPYKNGQIRNKPWRVRYFADSKARCKFFSTRDAAEAFATQQRQLLNRGLDPEDFRAATLLAKGTGFTLTQLVEMAINAIKANGTTSVNPNITFAEGAAMVIARAERRKRRPATIAGYKAHYAALNKAFGSRPIALIDKAFVQNYVDTLRNRAGDGPASQATKRDAVTNIRMVLAINGVVEPLRGVETQIGERPAVQFYTNEQVVQILTATLDEDRAMIAMALFGTVRPHTLERLLPRHVNVAERKIMIPANLTKDKVPHLVQAHAQLTPEIISPGAPDVMWAWLEKYPFNPRRWTTVQNYLKRKLGFWIQDGLRHTGGTYYCALWGVPATAELLTHKGTLLVKRHYVGATWKPEAQVFMNITPDKIPSNPGVRAQKRIVNWPSDAALSALLFKHTRKEVAQQLGCDVSAISNRCKKLGIAHPGRGWRTAKLVDTAVATPLGAVDNAA